MLALALLLTSAVGQQCEPAPGVTPTALPIPTRQPSPTPAPTSTQPSPTPLVTSPALQYDTTTTWSLPADPRIDRMRDTILVALARCQVTFPGENGEVHGFAPGADYYPTVYIRDLSTDLPAVRYFYPDDYLRSAIEEFLYRQYGPNTESENGHRPGAGAISAVVAPDGHIDKATAVSDEETSLIHAAYVYYQVRGGDDWLRKTINGRTVLERLNAAIDWLFDHRYEPSVGLVIRAHTTDWGDVKFEPAPNPTDINPSQDHWTASIYDQALAYRALVELEAMNRALGVDEPAQRYQQRATALRQSANEHLWQEGRGYYRLHLHVTPLEHDFDEDAIVAIGNIAAIYCGLAAPQQVQSILNALEQARLAAGAGKPGISLYPPYPRGFFAYGQMVPGRYQNGGLWDWWGGRQVQTEFAYGYSQVAWQHLQQVAADWDAHPDGIYEWQVADTGQRRGSPYYCGAAAVMASAIIDGLYGVSLDRQDAVLSPRLGDRDGYIRVYQPATDTYAAYDYLATEQGVRIDYGSNVAQNVTLRVLLPAGAAIQSLSLDAATSELAYDIEVIGQDTYCIVPVPPGLHRVDLSFTLTE